MPAPVPVTFDVSLAPLPLNFKGSPQDLASAIVQRLTVAPSAPWSSFQIGGALPGSDEGPVLLNGTEWRVFDPINGAYRYLTTDGAGLINGTVPLTALSGQTPYSILGYDVNGAPALVPTGTTGQVLTASANGPAFTNLPGRLYFEYSVGSDQPFATDGNAVTARFNTTTPSNPSPTATFDTVNYRLPVTAGSVWFLYAYLQIERSGTAGLDMQYVLQIRPNGGGNYLGAVHNDKVAAALTRQGVGTSGFLAFTADGYVDVGIAVNDAAGSTANGVTIAGNGENTRFGGFRLV